MASVLQHHTSIILPIISIIYTYVLCCKALIRIIIIIKVILIIEFDSLGFLQLHEWFWNHWKFWSLDFSGLYQNQASPLYKAICQPTLSQCWSIVRPAVTMAKKCILLSFLGRNKVAKIVNDDHSNISLLREEFKKLFSCESMKSSKIQFHRYSEEWQEYIELQEDEISRNKDKLNVTVSSISSPSTPEVSVTVYGFPNNHYMLPCHAFQISFQIVPCFP